LFDDLVLVYETHKKYWDSPLESIPMKQHDYLNGWWHLLPNLCLLTAIIGQFNPTALNSSTWGQMSIDRASTPTFSVKTPVQFTSPVQQPAI
jgi:hypothetical protein